VEEGDKTRPRETTTRHGKLFRFGASGVTGSEVTKAGRYGLWQAGRYPLPVLVDMHNTDTGGCTVRGHAGGVNAAFEVTNSTKVVVCDSGAAAVG